jgi:hypothetical protein
MTCPNWSIARYRYTHRQIPAQRSQVGCAAQQSHWADVVLHGVGGAVGRAVVHHHRCPVRQWGYAPRMQGGKVVWAVFTVPGARIGDGKPRG